MAIADYFLKIDGIQGESQDDKHKNEIEVHSFSWGSANQGTFSMGGGGGAGKTTLKDLVVLKHVDKASPKVLEACTTGKHIPSVILACRKAGGTQQEYLKITLSDVLVSQYFTLGGKSAQDDWDAAINYNSSKSNTGNLVAAAAGDGSDSLLPLEQISLNFGKIEYEYREQDSKGGTKGPVKTVWNAKQNKLG